MADPSATLSDGRQGPVVSTWKEYRAKRNLALLVFPGAFPVAFAVMILLVQVRAEYVIFPLSFAWMELLVFLSLRAR
jgi:hypothetical protein